MVTALVLLDVGATLGTGLAVGLDPAEVLVIRLLFGIPKLHLSAVGRLVVFLHAFDAERVATGTGNTVHAVSFVQTDESVAAVLRAPLDVLV